MQQKVSWTPLFSFQSAYSISFFSLWVCEARAPSAVLASAPPLSQRKNSSWSQWRSLVFLTFPGAFGPSEIGLLSSAAVAPNVVSVSSGCQTHTWLWVLLPSDSCVAQMPPASCWAINAFGLDPCASPGIWIICQGDESVLFSWLTSHRGRTSSILPSTSSGDGREGPVSQVVLVQEEVCSFWGFRDAS